ncbi:MAG: hypothetical protein AAFO63_10035 [Pseudomonadota bacterium]
MHDTDRNLEAGIIFAPNRADLDKDSAGQKVNEMTASSQPENKFNQIDTSSVRRAWRRRRTRRSDRGSN